ncbi:MAG: c-type cytochrome [Planctomycetia bacterium]|nr:c-type cytochrome [Planctomycetia bacterium]
MAADQLPVVKPDAVKQIAAAKQETAKPVAPADNRYTQKPEIAASNEAIAKPAAAAATGSSPFLAGPKPSWIWGPDVNKKYVVRKKYSGDVKSAVLKLSCDNLATIYINGRNAYVSNDWHDAPEIDVTGKSIQPVNVVEAEISNQGDTAGFVFKMIVTKNDGTVEYVVSDDSWEIADARDSTEWSKAKIVAAYGSGPWGEVLSGPSQAVVANQSLFNVPAGFQVEKLFTVPKELLGSWVNIATDNKGRLIVSDQGNLGLCRVTPPKLGSQDETQVERLDIKFEGKQMSGAQGLLWAFDALYVCCNGGPGSGLYRLKDTNGDDQFDEVVRLKDFRGGGEHGPHAIRLAPDGKSIYLVAGNHTLPPFQLKTNSPIQTMGGARTEQLHATLPEGATSRIAPNWDEDSLLPRQWDSNGHAAGIVAPGGWIAKTDPDGKAWEMFSVGYRNQYDFAFNGDGEMFAYDSDMEWDMGSPWYRPTRVLHATSGSEFGWRSGTANWPAYYVDSLPQLIDIGPGSPVGVEFGYGAKFPAKYQKALFICDWTFATMYAIHMVPDGASYKAVKEEFVARNALPLTDVTIGTDGAMYFTVGGRGTQSELFRVTYVGTESTAPVDRQEAAGAELRALRRSIEAYHRADVEDAAKAAAFLVPHLGHADQHIRYAARVALERLPLAAWQEQVLASDDAETVIIGVVGLARTADTPAQPKLLAALDKLNYAKLTEPQQVELLRAYQLVFIRLGLPDEGVRSVLGAKFDALFPGVSNAHNQELAILMVAMGSPGAAAKLMPMLSKEPGAAATVSSDLLARNKGYGGSIATMLANHPDLQQYQLAFTLRNLKNGWTPEQRKEYFSWFEKARKWSGGNSYQKFLTNIDNDAFANATDAERLMLESLKVRKPYVVPPLPKPKGPGRDYPAAEIVELSNAKLKGRNFKNGQQMYAAARCVVCHRFGGDGGSTGPDLTQLAGRFNVKDLTDSIVDPSKVISDQYKASVVETKDGKTYTGRIVSDAKDTITLVVDPENSSKVLEIKKSEIEQQSPSSVSLMPKDLLKTLNENELLDLMAYLLSRGNPQDAMFK